MDSRVRLYAERAENELRTAIILKNLSERDNEKIKLGALREDTFYSSVISHSYYSIFYIAKAILLKKGVKTEAPEVHKKTLEEFEKNLIDTGELDLELLKIYKKMILRAEGLLGLFRKEKKKRGTFTYKIIPQANIEPAEESIKNAKTFIKNIKAAIEADF